MQSSGNQTAQPGQGQGKQRTPSWRWLVIGLIVIAGLLIAAQVFLGDQRDTQEAPYSAFLTAVQEDRVQRAQISEGSVEWLPRDSEQWNVSTRVPGNDPQEAIRTMRDNGVEIEGETSSDFWPTALIWLLPLGLILAFWVFAYRRMSGGAGQAMSFGRSKAKQFDSASVGVDFSDVAGVSSAKTELQEIVDILKDPDRYRSIGARIPKGVMLTGPPGTGKTLLARATAGEAGVPFYSMSGSEFVEMFVGVGASRARDLFDKAKKTAPCIVFIDEIESIGQQRGRGFAGAQQEQEQTLNQLLAEIDGFDPSIGVIVMAATNRVDMVDSALLRPGRFDRRIEVEAPDRDGREEILQMHAKRVKLAEDVDLGVAAARTPGFAGASLANVINEAALLSARGGKTQVGMEDLDRAVERVMMGLESRSRVLNEAEKTRVAYHEMGHALVGLSLANTDPVHKVTVVSHGHALGMTVQAPLQDRYLFTVAQLEDRIAGQMGGRAAEELVFGNLSTGAANDLQQATQLARKMVREFGMGATLGPVAYPDQRASGDMSAVLGGDPYSEQTEQAIDREVKQIIDRNYDRAMSLLKERKDLFVELADELQEQETIDGQELKRRMEERYGVGSVPGDPEGDGRQDGREAQSKAPESAPSDSPQS